MYGSEPSHVFFGANEPVELKYRKPAKLVAGKFAGGMALLSLGLGLAEALMPKTLSSAICVVSEIGRPCRCGKVRQASEMFSPVSLNLLLGGMIRYGKTF